MEKYEPLRARKGCRITLKNTDTGDIVIYNLVSSLFDTSKWWKSPEDKVKDSDHALSIYSHLGVELLGKQIGDIVGKYEIKNIESTNKYVQNLNDSEENLLKDRQESLKTLLNNIQEGEWVNAHFMMLSPMYEAKKQSKTLIIPRIKTLNNKKYLDTIWLTNKGQNRKDGFLKASLLIYSDKIETGATAEMILDEDMIKKLAQDGAIPERILEDELCYIYSSSPESSNSTKLCSIEAMVSKEGQFACRVTSNSRSNYYYMSPVNDKL